MLAVTTGGYARKELATHKPDWLVDTLLEISPENL
jgi:phosphoglycolate phosphatase-like HAD superfamily hydrolase